MLLPCYLIRFFSHRRAPFAPRWLSPCSSRLPRYVVSLFAGFRVANPVRHYCFYSFRCTRRRSVRRFKGAATPPMPGRERCLRMRVSGKKASKFSSFAHVCRLGERSSLTLPPRVFFCHRGGDERCCASQTYELFDNIVLLAEGKVIFHGPREDIVPYFSSLGWVQGWGNFVRICFLSVSKVTWA